MMLEEGEESNLPPDPPQAGGTVARDSRISRKPYQSFRVEGRKVTGLAPLPCTGGAGAFREKAGG